MSRIQVVRSMNSEATYLREVDMAGSYRVRPVIADEIERLQAIEADCVRRGEADIEPLAAAVHQAYLDTCERLGWPVKPENQVPYAVLSEDSKELDRASVRAVLAAIAATSHEAEQAAPQGEAIEADYARRGDALALVGAALDALRTIASGEAWENPQKYAQRFLDGLTGSP